MIDAAGGASGSPNESRSALPHRNASSPGADPQQAYRYWAEPSATPEATPARRPIEPMVPERPDPAEILRRLTELATEEAMRTEVRVAPGQKRLPKRAERRADEPAAVPRRRRQRSEAEPSYAEKSVASIRSDRVESLGALMPRLGALAVDDRPEMRTLYALSVSMLACDGRARSDRELWRTLLGLSKYDPDAGVRRAADAALTDLEHHGTTPAQRD